MSEQNQKTAELAVKLYNKHSKASMALALASVLQHRFKLSTSDPVERLLNLDLNYELLKKLAEEE